MASAPVTLRALASADLPLLARWLAEPHLRPFYVHGDPPSAEEVARDYASRCKLGHATRALLACWAGRPFGYAQWYLNSSYADWTATIGRSDGGASIDYFIGEPAALGRGMGRAMLLAVLADMPDRLPQGDRCAHIGHDARNARAIRCTLSAGFFEAGAYEERGHPCRLFSHPLSDQRAGRARPAPSQPSPRP